MKTLILIRGLPGSGKTSLIQHLLLDAEFSADMYHLDQFGDYKWSVENVRAAHEWCQSSVRIFMTSHRGIGRDYTIAVHNTFTTEKEMQPYIKMAELFGVKVITLITENRHESKDVHNVPEETIQRMKERFEIKL